MAIWLVMVPDGQNNPASLLQRQSRSSETTGVTGMGAKLELEISLSSYALPGHTWFICMLHDISERKKMERLKSEFVATVSHELRTPLTAITGALGLTVGGALISSQRAAAGQKQTSVESHSPRQKAFRQLPFG